MAPPTLEAKPAAGVGSRWIAMMEFKCGHVGSSPSPIPTYANAFLVVSVRPASDSGIGSTAIGSTAYASSAFERFGTPNASVFADGGPCLPFVEDGDSEFGEGRRTALQDADPRTNPPTRPPRSFTADAIRRACASSSTRQE